MTEGPLLQELLFPRMYWSLRSAMMPVMSVNRIVCQRSKYSFHPLIRYKMYVIRVPCSFLP